jgi:hypothetical protein
MLELANAKLQLDSEVTGGEGKNASAARANGGAAAEDGDDGGAEKRMKKVRFPPPLSLLLETQFTLPSRSQSLLSNLKKQFELADSQAAAAGGASIKDEKAWA